MFSRARQRNYEKLFGSEVARAFVDFDQLCKKHPRGRGFSIGAVEKILAVEPDYRLQALLYLSAQVEVPIWQDEATKLITGKNQWEHLAQQHRIKLAHPAVTPKERERLEDELKAMESLTPRCLALGWKI